ncbi:MAG: hypothetical protein B7Y36_06155 [Novosphingobium sp. 28-62-57]|uniref:hypothetical protein n=1 Tax=unclassified Novosphingobium TaxID=2644732 RepID=UPI000BC96A66|nr:MULTISPECIES: hypothetical protein [unclassified Novosphingobium]OYW50180.1 MAG: hypothetical protein B7Z34_04760 [Novosphingobium sp. 12-62-10]OYZ11715.1 MAG: hypothetical protein B7Y36_06155 [Novosphingobium sp. 28-62-57]OZA37229.1 MAG: hypothetical protein B7X92_05015 [Novosphingobium sp. 17-62-9]
MGTYIVTYDLLKQGQNYDCITKKLKAYPTHWHMQGSVWLIETSQTAVQVRDNLSPCLDQNDKLFVASLDGEAAWSGYSNQVSNWVKARLEKTA